MCFFLRVIYPKIWKCIIIIRYFKNKLWTYPIADKFFSECHKYNHTFQVTTGSRPDFFFASSLICSSEDEKVWKLCMKYMYFFTETETSSRCETLFNIINNVRRRKRRMKNALQRFVWVEHVFLYTDKYKVLFKLRVGS